MLRRRWSKFLPSHEHIDATFYYLRKKFMYFPKLLQRKGSHDSLLKIILGVSIRCSLSWFEVNTVLIPMHLEYLKHWVLAKLDLLNWTVEVYDSLNSEGPHNDKIRESLECMSKFVPMLAERISLFEFKPRNSLRTYPIPVTIMQDIP
ncbi:hypothetical protein TIFTF001_017745 [Ficus carica]|uniref:Ubiquitin-like protease family profile domain-containing protein n=1 Tax=Ficus carica TaxID=3494 RepID=A0AA88AB92_FICCA|nr:hypothetical protein TIFTF001_017745 [Ficus carica]